MKLLRISIKAGQNALVMQPKSIDLSRMVDMSNPHLESVFLLNLQMKTRPEAEPMHETMCEATADHGGPGVTPVTPLATKSPPNEERNGRSSEFRTLDDIAASFISLKRLLIVLATIQETWLMPRTLFAPFPQGGPYGWQYI